MVSDPALGHHFGQFPGRLGASRGGVKGRDSG